jgi:glycosyltransferase involved in cell wall biosynthesis
MRVCLLGDGSSIHLKRWATSLAQAGLEIHLITFPPDEEVEGATYHFLPRSTGTRLDYFLNAPRVRKLVRKIQPDLLHAHYATSYGRLGARANFHPYVLSVWGSDVFAWPRKGAIPRALLKANLKAADQILSTSQVMADETNKYTAKKIEVTPFGIDLDQFKPMEVDPFFNKDSIVVGTIKSLEPLYGIDSLILAFDMVCRELPDQDLRLLIVGDGSQRAELEALVNKLGIKGKAHFAGRVGHAQLPTWYNRLDVYAALSRPDSESFGVAVIEASACERAVLVSNTGGLPEVVADGQTGLLAEPNDLGDIKEKLLKLVQNEDLRRTMGAAGRRRVAEKYDWDGCVRQMISIYESVIA